ncbi:MAG: OmpA family protein [Saprospiraceae bacterium]|nr:OmpA family protein [Saprospiraceae bacterium]
MRNTFSNLLLLMALAVMPFSLIGQQSGSSKTKGTNKFYEKTGGKGIVITNATAINTEHLDFSPVFYNNGLVFVSSRKKGGFLDSKIGETYFELYYTRVDPNGTPVEPEIFSGQLNSQLHEGPVAFSRNGDQIFFTSNNQKHGLQRADDQGRVRLKIYTAQRGNQDWENVTELPFNADEYSSQHPSLSRDGKRLFFASDRPGGYGGYDIWFVDRTTGGWSDPVNLGPAINSKGNEVFPFIHYSGYLFYSSDGSYEGLGGLDIFSVNTRNLPDAHPQIFSAPFNTPFDDLGFVLEDDGLHGFFSSDRPGGVGKDDIYQFESAYSLAGDLDNFVARTMVEIVDETTGQPIPDASIFILEKDAYGFVSGETIFDMALAPEASAPDKLTLNLVRKKTLDLNAPDTRSDASGMALSQMKIDQNYLILVSKPGYITKEFSYTSPPEPTADEIVIRVRPQDCFLLEGRVKNQKTGVLMAHVPVMIEMPDGTPVYLESDINGTFSYCLSEAADYSLSANKEGYIPGRSRVSTSNGNYAETRKTELLLLPFSGTPVETAVAKPIGEGSVIVLENLYYDYNKSSLRPGAANELDVVYDLLKKYPSMEIELGAHTDCRGSDKFNQRLSESRAAAAKNYLVSRGIQPARITAVGYGETMLRNQCTEGVNCTEEQHQYNRRTEILITTLDEPVEIRYEEDK